MHVMVVANAIKRLATTILIINFDNDKKPATKTIAPELLRQIQVEGITDDDYRRVEPKIETIEQMAALFTEGMFIFDLFKMDYHYIAPNIFCSKAFMQQDLLGHGLIIFETRITAYG